MNHISLLTIDIRSASLALTCDSECSNTVYDN